MRRLTRILALVAITFAGAAGLLLLSPPQAASAHDERDTVAPDGSGKVPTYRTAGPTLLVCKADKTDFDKRIAGFPADLRTINLSLWTQCQKSGYRHLQEAVNNVKQPGMTIKVLPGVYHEEPSLATPSAWCANLPARTTWPARYQSTR